MVDAAHSLRLLQVEVVGLHVTRDRRLEEGHHHDEQHDGELPDPGHVGRLDVEDDSPQLGVKLVGGDEVEGLRLAEVLSVGERESGLTPAEVHADGGLHDLDGADVVPVEGGPVAGGEAVEAVEAGEEDPHPGHGLGQEPGHQGQVVRLALGLSAGD